MNALHGTLNYNLVDFLCLFDEPLKALLYFCLSLSLFIVAKVACTYDRHPLQKLVIFRLFGILQGTESTPFHFRISFIIKRGKNCVGKLIL